MHHLDNDGTAENNDRHGNNHAEDQKPHVAACRTDDAENIIKTHEGIGRNNSSDSSRH